MVDVRFMEKVHFGEKDVILFSDINSEDHNCKNST